MGRRRRDALDNDNDPFASNLLANEDDGSSDTTIEEADHQLNGGRLGITGKRRYRQVVKAYPINKIRTNPQQPRRVLPSAVREIWDGKMENFVDSFAYWNELANDEVGYEVDVLSFFHDTDDIDDIESYPPIAKSFVSLLQLAANIRRNGLTHPIAIYQEGEDSYVVETGERRFLAYYVLHHLFLDDDNETWNEIPARVMKDFDYFRVAAENTQRADLNAIGIARQVALLIMQLNGWDNFKSYDEVLASGGTEQDFYAQVADGNEWRIPRGKAGMILELTGLASPERLRRYRALLKLPYKKWSLADDHNLSEWDLRPKAKPSTPPTTTVQMALKKALRSMKTLPANETIQQWKKEAPDSYRQFYQEVQAYVAGLPDPD